MRRIIVLIVCMALFVLPLINATAFAVGDKGLVNSTLDYNRFLKTYNGFQHFQSFANTSYIDSSWNNADYIGSAGGIAHRVINCNEYVNARAEADSSAPSLLRFNLGSDVAVLGYWNKWALCVCAYNPDHIVCGWVKRDYLMPLESIQNTYTDYYHGSSESSGGGTDQYDLSNFGYRSVETKGRGALVFQSSPRGSFMTNHKFTDGDQIYVDVYWQEDGYAMAYEDGEYGYVDASYIEW